MFVRIDEDEKPAEETAVTRSERKLERARNRDGRHSKFCAIMCKDRMFQIYLVRAGWLKAHWRKQTREQMAAQWICDVCGLKSRAELDEAEANFDCFREKVEKPFYRWMQDQKKVESAKMKD